MHFDIFNDDAFSLVGLTASIQDAEYVPGRIGQLGLFDESGISTTSVSIEKVGDTLRLVPAEPRGSSGQLYKAEKRNMRNFTALHLPQRGAVMADEILGMRAWGSESEVEVMSRYVQTQYLAKMKRDIEATQEHLRIGAIKGLVKDADGTTTLLNLFTEFGVTQATVNWDLDGVEDVRQAIVTLKRNVASKLKGIPFNGIMVLCGSTFFDALIGNSTVEAAYDRYMDGGFLRDDYSAQGQNGFTFGSTGVRFEEYRGSVGGVDFIPATKAYAVPLGVPELFITRFAPGDYMQTVNTMGLPYYATQERMPHDKGIALEAQSNPIHLCTRPDIVYEITAV